MRTGLIFLLSAVMTVFMVFGALMFKDPLPPLIAAVLSFPLWIVSFAFATLRLSGSIDILQLQQYSDIAQIRRNTDKHN